VDAVVEDQVRGDVGGPVGVRLAVALEDLHRIGAGAHLDRVLREELLEGGDDVLVGLAERRQRPGLGAHVPDPDRVAAPAGGRVATRQCGRARRRGAGGDRDGTRGADGPQEAAAVERAAGSAVRWSQPASCPVRHDTSRSPLIRALRGKSIMGTQCTVNRP
jgi:hypothetical protein